MGLLDRNAVNVYIVMQGRHKPDAYRHSTFNQNLMTQLFHIARKQNAINDLSAANIVEEYDYSILWPCAPVSFHNPLPTPGYGFSRACSGGAFRSQSLFQLQKGTKMQTGFSANRLKQKGRR